MYFFLYMDTKEFLCVHINEKPCHVHVFILSYLIQLHDAFQPVYSCAVRFHTSIFKMQKMKASFFARWKVNVEGLSAANGQGHQNMSKVTCPPYDCHRCCTNTCLVDFFVILFFLNYRTMILGRKMHAYLLAMEICSKELGCL